MVSRKARELAAATGRLPHEILLSIARGEPFAWGPNKESFYPSPEMMIDAAKAAAPYYAPRLAQVEQQTEIRAELNQRTIDGPPQETREEWERRIAARRLGQVS